ncbi:MAG: class I SAM-dependent methyltransferase [Kiloniellales bacterium]
MSRLDSAIRRLEAQRATLERAAELIRDLPGPLLEVGLGNGRTFDHLRERLPGREIFVFDRALAAHPACRPDRAHFLEGDLAVTLPDAVRRFGGSVALVHSDIGNGEAAGSVVTAALVARHLPALLAPGGLAASDQPLTLEGFEALALPDGVKPGRYFLYRAPGSRLS